MNPWINYHHLYYFKTIAEEGTVSKAAQKLRLGQPTLSAQLKQLEDNLGVRLFERQKKRLNLTEQGRQALEYARMIFRLGGEMYEVLHDRVDPRRTHLQIGALDSVAKQVTMQLTRAAYKIEPTLVSVEEGKLHELLDALLSRRLDLVVTNFLPSTRPLKGVVYRQVSQSPVSIYGAPKFKSLRRGFPRSLEGQPIVLPTYDSKLRHDVEQWFLSRQVRLNVIAETQDLSLTKLMSCEGLGLIPAASHSVHRQTLGGELLKLGPLTGLSEQLMLVRAEHHVQHKLATQLYTTFKI